MAEPRHLVVPDGATTTGWPAVRDTCRQVGVEFDPWQAMLARLILSKEPSGLYAADTVVMSICRQAGKTYLVAAVILADSLINPGTTTVWTAHKFSTARESFDQLRSFATLPKMSAHVDPEAITTGAGNEVIPFRNGSRIMFKARQRGSVRGFSNVRRLVVDECQILTESQMSDMVPTQNHAHNPQAILMGTPPRLEDPSEFFEALRDGAVEGGLDGTLYCEYGADPDVDPMSWEAVEQANPSFPLRTGKRAIGRLRRLLGSPEAFAREGLGIWAKEGAHGPFPEGSWGACEDSKSEIANDSEISFCMDVSWDRTRTYIAAAGHREDGRPHGEVIEAGVGTDWVVDWFTATEDEDGNPVDRKGIPVVVQAKRAPASSLIRDLEDAGVTVVEWDGVSGTAELYDAVRAATDGEPGFFHLGQPALNVAAANAATRPVGDAWAWDRRKSPVDAAPLVAVTGALWGLTPQPTKTPTVHAWPEEAEDEDRLVPA